MKVVYVGNFEPEYSTENDVRKAFIALGHEVVAIQENKTSVRSIEAEMETADLLLITSTWDDALPLGEWLGLMHRLAQRNKATATLHLDTFWGKSRGGRAWWLNPMFHTAYIFTADGDCPNEWRLMGKNHIWLPPAVRHDAAHFGKKQPEYACDVAFVGSNGIGYHEDVWGYRKALVDELRAICARRGWSFKNPGGDDPKIERGEAMNDFYASAKVTIGDSLCLNYEDSRYWSDRVPEATGRGGFLIMPKIKSLSEYWPDLPLYDWRNFKQLEELIAKWLNDDFERDMVREKNQEITARSNTYIDRVETILEEIFQ